MSGIAARHKFALITVKLLIDERGFAFLVSSDVVRAGILFRAVWPWIPEIDLHAVFLIFFISDNIMTLTYSTVLIIELSLFTKPARWLILVGKGSFRFNRLVSDIWRCVFTSCDLHIIAALFMSSLETTSRS